MTMYGADAEALDTMARRFSTDAAHFHQIRTRLNGQIHNTRWTGPAAERFLIEWNQRYSRSLNAATALLEEMARTLRRNAQEQRAASDRGSGVNRWVLPGWHKMPSGIGSPPCVWIGPHNPRIGSSNKARTMPGNLLESVERFKLIDVGDWLLKARDVREGMSVAAPIYGAIRTLGGTVSQAANGGLQIAAAGSKVTRLGLVGLGLGVVDTGIAAHKYGWTDGITYTKGAETIIPFVASLTPAGPAGGLVASLAMKGTSAALTALDKHIDYSGAFISSVQARTGKVPDYSGWTGMGKYLYDGGANIFSKKAWGFR